MLRIGTSGYSYPEWKGPVYPENIKNNDMLNFYSGLFNTAETTFVFTNNHYGGAAVRTAVQLEGLLKKEGVAVN